LSNLIRFTPIYTLLLDSFPRLSTHLEKPYPVKYFFALIYGDAPLLA